MSQSQPHSQQAMPDEREFWVVSRVPEGFRVYQAGKPHDVYLVTGTAERPSCTCGVRALTTQGPADRCIHVQSVFGLNDPGNLSDDETEVEVQSDCGGGVHPDDGFAPTQLLLKRSVSPDGRINALSVEFSLACDLGNAQMVMDDAIFTLGLQAKIVERFLSSHRPTGNGSRPPANGNGRGNDHALPLGEPIPARLRDIDGMQTRMGWSYYINVEVGDQLVKLFGNRRKIQDYIGDAGYENAPQVRNIAKGTALDIPCRVILSRRENDKYLSVEEVMPVSTPPERYANRRGGR